MKTRLKMVNLPYDGIYRGVHRYRLVNFVHEHPEGHVIYDYWNESLEFDYNEVDNVHRACEVLHLLNSYASVSERCELIEITEFQNKPNIGKIFYGYDIASTYTHSLLRDDYLSKRVSIDDKINITSIDTMEDALSVFYRLARNYFRTCLNKYGLFDEYDDARLAAEFIAAVKFIAPPGYLDPVPFVPLGVWYVDGPLE